MLLSVTAEGKSARHSPMITSGNSGCAWDADGVEAEEAAGFLLTDVVIIVPLGFL